MTLKLDNVVGLRAGVPLRLKFASGQTAAGAIEGYASTFGGQPDAYDDIIAPGAFTATLRANNKAGRLPVMLWCHDTTRPIGRWVEMREDGRGLFVKGQLNLQSNEGAQAYEHVKEGDVSGLSIGFRELPGGRTFNQDGTSTLTAVELGEVSIVSMPANDSARITSVKSVGSQVDLERLLRDAGLARGAAVKLAAGGWPALSKEPSPTNPDLGPLIARIKAATLELKKGQSPWISISKPSRSTSQATTAR